MASVRGGQNPLTLKLYVLARTNIFLDVWNSNEDDSLRNLVVNWLVNNSLFNRGNFYKNMKYVIKGWSTLARGFLFKQLYPAGWGSLTGQPHLGLDVIAPAGTPIIAWQDLAVTSFMNGPEGGYTIQVRCANNPRMFRLMHLQRPVACGKYKEGQILAYVGTTGSACRGAHLHIDTSKNGQLNIYNINNFEDPEWYFKMLKYTA
jgi:murein DD-endopeptidase MepM/ murein hydrolase activator NlpD